MSLPTGCPQRFPGIAIGGSQGPSPKTFAQGPQCLSRYWRRGPAATSSRPTERPTACARSRRVRLHRCRGIHHHHTTVRGSIPVGVRPFTHTTAWRTFDGFLCVTFGFVFTIGMAMLLMNLVGSGITCPRCFTRNPGAASVCLTCDLPLPPRPTASLWRRWSSGSGTTNRPR